MQSKVRMIMFVIVFMITITTLVPSSVYGLMTKEKLNELLTKRGELIGQPYEPQVYKPEGLEGMTHKQKIEWLANSNYTSPEQKLEELMTKIESSPNFTKGMTYEERYLEITNEHFGTNYTSMEEASLGLYEKFLIESEEYLREMESLEYELGRYN